ncbi:MAG: hypothetical protein MZW92_34530 [Comamonadaceae bacterium]|nr:hypothetical protein [Comamonadaceae bacterium]
MIQVSGLTFAEARRDTYQLSAQFNTVARAGSPGQGHPGGRRHHRSGHRHPHRPHRRARRGGDGDRQGRGLPYLRQYRLDQDRRRPG